MFSIHCQEIALHALATKWNFIFLTAITSYGNRLSYHIAAHRSRKLAEDRKEVISGVTTQWVKGLMIMNAHHLCPLLPLTHYYKWAYGCVGKACREVSPAYCARI